MTIDLSPSMLKFFLQANVAHAGNVAARFPPARRTEDRDRRNAEKGRKTDLRIKAKVSRHEFDAAWAGRLTQAAPRERLWLALGVDTVAMQILLTDDGGQEDRA